MAATMRGYKVKTIKGIDFSAVPPIVTFEDTHGKDFSLSCTCPQFSELAIGLDASQLLRILNRYPVTLIIRDQTIRKFNVGFPPGSTVSRVTIQGRSAGQPGKRIEESQEKFERSDAGANPSLSALTIDQEERQQYAEEREIMRRLAAPQIMYCEFCEKDVPVLMKRRGQFRRQYCCEHCNKLVHTEDYTD